MPPKRGRGGKAATTKSSRPAKIRRVKEVVFDEDARKEYLTGFSKRKQARELAVRTKAIDREREEKNESRRHLRQERKDRAALNVRNARELYGDAGDGEDDELHLEGDEDDDAPPKDRAEAAYESTELVTTVLVESFALSRSSSPVFYRSPSPDSADPDAVGKPRKAKPPVVGEGGAPSAKKRVRNKPQFRPKMSREDKKARATAGKSKAAGFLRSNRGTKGKSNKG